MFIESLNVLYMQQMADFIADVGHITSDANLQQRAKAVFDYHRRLVTLTQQLRIKASTAKEKPQKLSTHSKHVTIKTSESVQEDEEHLDRETASLGIAEADPSALIGGAETLENDPNRLLSAPDPCFFHPNAGNKAFGYLVQSKEPGREAKRGSPPPPEEPRSLSLEREALETSQGLADKLFSTYDRKKNAENGHEVAPKPLEAFGAQPAVPGLAHLTQRTLNDGPTTAPKPNWPSEFASAEPNRPFYTPFLARAPNQSQNHFGIQSAPGQASVTMSGQDAFEMYRQINQNQGQFQFKKLRLDTIPEETPRWDFQENNYDISDCEDDGGSNDKVHNFEYEEEINGSTAGPSKGPRVHGQMPGQVVGKKLAVRCNGKAIPRWARDMEAVSEAARRQKDEIDFHEVFGVLPVINNLDVDKIFGTNGLFTKRGTSNQWATKSGIQQIRQEKRKRAQGLLVQDLK